MHMLLEIVLKHAVCYMGTMDQISNNDSLDSYTEVSRSKI